MTSKFVLYSVLTILLSPAWATAATQDRAQGGDMVHVVAGVVTKLDAMSKTIVVRTADGTEEIFKYTTATTVHASEDAAKAIKTGAGDSYLAGKEGTHVIVHYTGEGSDKAAIGIDDFGQDTLKVSKGTVIRVDRAGRTFVIRGEDGAEDIYHVAEDATIDSEHGIVKGAELTAKEGANVTVHYTEKAGRKIAHLVKEI